MSFAKRCLLLCMYLILTSQAEAMNLGDPFDCALMPIRFKISERVIDKGTKAAIPTPAGIQNEIRRAFASFAAISGVDLRFQYDGLYQPKPGTTPEPGTILVLLEPAAGVGGSATGGPIRDRSGKVVAGTITLNTRDYDYVHDKGGYVYQAIRHELGHVLGLGHSPVSGATMGYRREEWQVFSTLDDEDAVRQLYPSAQARGGALEVSAVLRGVPAGQVEIALVDAVTGIGRFQVTSAQGRARFAFVPLGRYLVAGREVIPTGPCDFNDRPKHFLTSFYAGAQSSNDPAKATPVEITEQKTAIQLPLIEGMKRFDCYYGYSGASHYLVAAGGEATIQLVKDQWEKTHRSETSGGVPSGTRVVPAGSAPGYTIASTGPEDPETLSFKVSVAPGAAPGPRVVYAENQGEYALAAVGFYIVERLAPESNGHLRDPL